MPQKILLLAASIAAFSSAFCGPALYQGVVINLPHAELTCRMLMPVQSLMRLGSMGRGTLTGSCMAIGK
jgi:hypothetical protein